jgi:hypothetical protein
MIYEDPFSPINFSYCRDLKSDKVLSVIQTNSIIQKIFPEINEKTLYHFTNKGKEIINSVVFKFYWQMRNNNNMKDEVLSKYWFTEANKNSDGLLQWQTHEQQFKSFPLAQITRTACFFTGEKESKDADLMKEKFGKDILEINYTLFKKDVESFCFKNNKKLYINKVNYVESIPKDFYPLPILGKTVGAVGLEVSSIIDSLMQDGTCFNKTQEHKFEHELRFIFFDKYAVLDPSTEYIEVPISKESMRLL